MTAPQPEYSVSRYDAKREGMAIVSGWKVEASVPVRGGRVIGPVTLAVCPDEDTANELRALLAGEQVAAALDALAADRDALRKEVAWASRQLRHWQKAAARETADSSQTLGLKWAAAVEALREKAAWNCVFDEPCGSFADEKDSPWCAPCFARAMLARLGETP